MFEMFCLGCAAGVFCLLHIACHKFYIIFMGISVSSFSPYINCSILMELHICYGQARWQV